jgi:hypothetical protein
MLSHEVHGEATRRRTLVVGYCRTYNDCWVRLPRFASTGTLDRRVQSEVLLTGIIVTVLAGKVPGRFPL